MRQVTGTKPGQVQIVQLLVKRVTVSKAGLDVRLRITGLRSLMLDMRTGEKAA